MAGNDFPPGVSVGLLIRSVVDTAGPRRVWITLVLLTATIPPLVVGLPLVEKQLIDGVFLAHRPDKLLGLLGIYAGLWGFSIVASTARSTLGAYQGELVIQQFRQRLLAHAADLSLAYWHRDHTGRLLALYHNDVSRMTGLFSATVVAGTSCVVGVLLGGGVMFQLNWQLAIVTTLAPLVAGGISFVLTRPLRSLARRAQDKAEQLTEQLEENLSGLREIVAFGREALRTNQFATGLRELLQLRMRITLANSAFGVGQSVFSFAVFLAILGYGGYLVLNGKTTLGTLMAMRVIFDQTFMAAKQLVGLSRDIQMALASSERVYSFFDERAPIVDREDARELLTVRGAVTFDDVSFAYQTGHTILHDLSLNVEPGEVVALVGPSGAGKTTLVSLISRFYDPTLGRVRLDGVDLRDLKLASLRRQIGIVFQDTFLFSATIRENIAFGRSDASDADIIRAARLANAWEFIEGLPSQLDTWVGQRGVQLSEGQKQRIAIARALLRDPRILILDEPTSALDARSESLLQSALQNLMRGRTTFIIAHRLATVQRADKIVVLEGGRIVEQGRHDTLLARRGLYRELHDLQFAGTEETPETRNALPSLAG